MIAMATTIPAHLARISWTNAACVRRASFPVSHVTVQGCPVAKYVMQLCHVDITAASKAVMNLVNVDHAHKHV